MKNSDLHFVRVFAAGKDGGNPAPVVLGADHLSDQEMQSIARTYGHESAFVCAPHHSNHTFRFRFFVPGHEMEMCGHATLGALWLLRHLGVWNASHATIETMSGIVDARLDEDTQAIEISQPKGIVETIDDKALFAATLEVLGLRAQDLLPLSIVNASTSRVKTLIPVSSVAGIHALKPSFDDVRILCDALGSTGLYPFAIDTQQPLSFHARQFPRSSGYPEDAATGIAAAALLYGAEHYGLLEGETARAIVHQGFAMGKPSRISVEFRDQRRADQGCWISGPVELTTLQPAS